VPLATQAVKESGYSPTELKVQAIARRRAEIQLMRVPWPRFRKAYEEYPRWHALILWTHAIVASQGRIPSWLIAYLRKRCPGLKFTEVGQPEPVDLRLSNWVRNHKFGYAKKEGWLDALTFYGVRRPRSERVWSYWEQCGRDWNKREPEVSPTFDVWWSDAQKMTLCDKLSYRDLGRAVEKYIDWEALVFWLRPLFTTNAKLPMHVMSELRRKFPGILTKHNSDMPRGDQENSKIWRRLTEWGNNHFSREAKEADSLELLLQRVQSHPLHVRLVHYGKYWEGEWSGNWARSYPSFPEWRRAADRYVVELKLH